MWSGFLAYPSIVRTLYNSFSRTSAPDACPCCGGGGSYRTNEQVIQHKIPKPGTIGTDCETRRGKPYTRMIDSRMQCWIILETHQGDQRDVKACSNTGRPRPLKMSLCAGYSTGCCTNVCRHSHLEKDPKSAPSNSSETLMQICSRRRSYQLWNVTTSPALFPKELLSADQGSSH
jgi:hypothetical protein